MPKTEGKTKQMATYLPGQKSALDPLSPDELNRFTFGDYSETEEQKDWKVMPPLAISGRLPAVQSPRSANTGGRMDAVQADLERQRNQEGYAGQANQAANPAGSSQEALCRVSFVGPDQQWYSIKIGHGSSGSAQPAQAPMAQTQVVQTSPLRQPGYQQTAAPMQTPPTWPQEQASWQQQGQLAQTPASWQQSAMMQAQPLQGAWNPNDFAGSAMLGGANIGTSGRVSDALELPKKESEKEEKSKDFILQIVQPSLTGLMDGSVSTLAPIFSVAFATHNTFTTFLVGLASALGAGISMTFSEALSDDGEISGRGNPFLRGGVTGLMTFLSGMGHALPFLIPSVQLALYTAYAVVAVELFVIAAIRHKFFGTGWLLSIVQVVGGGALVFVVALLLGNA